MGCPGEKKLSEQVVKTADQLHVAATADVLVAGNGTLGKVARAAGEMDPNLGAAEVRFFTSGLQVEATGTDEEAGKTLRRKAASSQKARDAPIRVLSVQRSRRSQSTQEKTCLYRAGNVSF